MEERMSRAIANWALVSMLAGAAAFAPGARAQAPCIPLLGCDEAPPPPATEPRRYEESHPAVSFGFGWNASGAGWFAWSGGGALETSLPGARASFSFSGTSVTWIGYRSGRSGIARVSVDGQSVAEVDLFARTDEVRAPILTLRGLAPGAHTLTVEATGLKNVEAVGNLVQVDAFDVPAPALSHLQDTDPDLSYTGAWGLDPSGTAWSAGFAREAQAAGARATLAFRGTSIAWRGYRGPDAGVARVYVDGAFAAEVDAYAPTHFVQDVVYAVAGLADGPHTFTIEATDQRHPEASGARIVLDAFDVTAPGERHQETDPAASYQGEWTHGNRNRTWSEGTAAVASAAGASVSFSFTGTEVRWIGFRAARTGIANVYVDGLFVAEVDTYAPAAEGYQDTVYTASALAPGAHTITVEATGRKHPEATSNYVVLDAFDVVP
jgi:hypothetical protein